MPPVMEFTAVRSWYRDDGVWTVQCFKNWAGGAAEAGDTAACPTQLCPAVETGYL